MKKKLIDWEQLLKDEKAYCYIKTNRHIHDSGFRCFEVGYCTMDKSGKRIKDKLVLSDYADHFWHEKNLLNNDDPPEFSMDILLDGYIRIFSHQHILTWGNNYKWVTSSFSLEKMKG